MSEVDMNRKIIGLTALTFLLLSVTVRGAHAVGEGNSIQLIDGNGVGQLKIGGPIPGILKKSIISSRLESDEAGEEVGIVRISIGAGAVEAELSGGAFGGYWSWIRNLLPRMEFGLDL